MPHKDKEKRKEARAAYYAANKDRIRADQAEYRAANIEKIKAGQAVYYAANADKLRSKVAIWAAANPDRVKANKAAYYVANASTLIAKASEWYEANRERSKATKAAYRANNLDKERCSQLRRKFGITLEERDQLIAAQDGQCAICLVPLETLQSRHIHVDHDHDTGFIRGVLCHACNVGLGCFRDSPDSMVRAITYLGRAQLLG